MIGAGFAGIRAARDLSRAGHSVLVLEARDRVGGRTWTVPFEGTDHRVELGGAWVAPKFHRWVAEEQDRYGLKITGARDELPNFRWRFDNQVSDAFPVSGDDLYALERSVYEILRGARRIDTRVPRDKQDLADLDVPVATFLDKLGVRGRPRDFLAAWATLGSGAELSDWSALTALSVIAAFDCSAFAWFAAVAEKFSGGTASVLETMIDDSAVTVLTSTPITRIDSRDTDVLVTAAGGRQFIGELAVVALPMNTWPDVEFVPGLSNAKAAAGAVGHAGRMRKVWALVEGAPRDLVCFGWGNELLILSTEYEVGDASLMVGMSAPPASLDVTSRTAVEAAVRQYLPAATVLSARAYDWSSDPFARGTWMANRPGQLSSAASSLQQPEGRLLFAGSDIATRWIGWIDGALETGAIAARQALVRLGGSVHAAS